MWSLYLCTCKGRKRRNELSLFSLLKVGELDKVGKMIGVLCYYAAYFL